MDHTQAAFVFAPRQRISKDEASILNLFACFLNHSAMPAFVEEVKKLFSPRNNPNITMSFIRTSLNRLSDFSGCLLVVQSGKETHVLIELEPKLIRLAIQRLLGQNEQEPVDQRALTQVEEGLFSFLMLSFLRNISALGPMPWQLTGIFHSHDQIKKYFSNHETNHCLEYQLLVNGLPSTVRVVAPTSFFPEQKTAPRIKSLLKRLSFLSIPIAINIGSVKLTIQQLSSIEKGDVIVVKQAVLRPNVKCKIGDPTVMEFEGQLRVLESGVYELIVKSYACAIQSNVEQTLEQEEVTLLAQLDSNISIELTKVNLSLASVAALSPGQIIETTQTPDGPVNLVVSGTKIGTGELVEIEGFLGVRIVALT